MDEEFESKLDYYISIGVVELVGMDENGEVVYEITEKAETDAPELWEAHTEYVDSVLLELYEKGLISIEYNEDLEAMINMTPEGYEAVKELGLISLENDEGPEN